MGKLAEVDPPTLEQPPGRKQPDRLQDSLGGPQPGQGKRLCPLFDTVIKTGMPRPLPVGWSPAPLALGTVSLGQDHDLGCFLASPAPPTSRGVREGHSAGASPSRISAPHPTYSHTRSSTSCNLPAVGALGPWGELQTLAGQAAWPPVPCLPHLVFMAT